MKWPSGINIWSVEQKRVVQHFGALVGGTPDTHALSFSPDSKWLAFCSSNASLQVYAVADWHPVHNQHKPDGFCRSRVAFSDDGKQLAVNGRDLVILNTSDWSTAKTVDSTWRRGKGTAVFVFVPGTHDLIIGGDTSLPEYPGQKDPPDFGALWVLAEDETIPGRRILVYPIEPESHLSSPVISLAISRDGRQLVTGAITGNGNDGHPIRAAIRIIDLRSGLVVASPLDGVAKSHQNGLAYSSDGRYVIVGDRSLQSPKIYLVSTSSLAQIDTIKLSETAWDVAANPVGDGFAVATGTRIGIWDMH